MLVPYSRRLFVSFARPVLQLSSLSGNNQTVDECRVSRLPEHLVKEISVNANTLSEKRALFGKVGLASKVDASCLWPTKDELNEMKDYESRFEPSLETLLAAHRTEQERQAHATKERETKVNRAMSKMSELVSQFNTRRTRRAGEISKIDEKRQALLDEAREYFGYDISPRDPRFLELVERKQEEEKRLKKKLRKEKRVERTVLSLTGGAASGNAAPGKKNEDTSSTA